MGKEHSPLQEFVAFNRVASARLHVSYGPGGYSPSGHLSGAARTLREWTLQRKHRRRIVPVGDVGHVRPRERYGHLSFDRMLARPCWCDAHAHPTVDRARTCDRKVIRVNSLRPTATQGAWSRIGACTNACAPRGRRAWCPRGDRCRESAEPSCSMLRVPKPDMKSSLHPIPVTSMPALDLGGEAAREPRVIPVDRTRPKWAPSPRPPPHLVEREFRPQSFQRFATEAHGSVWQWNSRRRSAEARRTDHCPQLASSQSLGV